MMELMERHLKILRELAKDGRRPISDISRALGLSHTAVRKHLERLRRERLVDFKPLLNFEKLGFRIAVMLLEIDTLDNLREIAKKFERCPRLVHMFQARGSLNLIAMMAAESEEVLDSITGTCMIRTSEGVRRSEIVEITEPLVNPFLPISLPSMDQELAPCGADCAFCRRYEEGTCPGCPAFKGYRIEAFMG
ncbi:MAG TPA: Lrp/AsnC family transcriptional regulator [Candidatus Korarchaeota archaeon]|nr:Lrp/AsnC family transcriptional regulator [Candidatus Korarchaeota archaeon]